MQMFTKCARCGIRHPVPKPASFRKKRLSVGRALKGDCSNQRSAKFTLWYKKLQGKTISLSRRRETAVFAAGRELQTARRKANRFGESAIPAGEHGRAVDHDVCATEEHTG